MMCHFGSPLYRGSALKKKRSVAFMFLVTLAILTCLGAAYWFAHQIDTVLP